MERALEFLKAIKSTDGVIVVFHNDVDGVCSCALLNKYLHHIGVKPYIISQPMPPDKNLLRRIQSGVPNKIIFLDLAMDQQLPMLMKIRGIADILIIDHHFLAKNVNSQSVTHYNPRFKNPKIYQSASYLLYKMCSKLFDIKDSIWIAAIGIIGDYDTSRSEDVLKEAEKNYDIKLFNRIAAMIESVRATKAMSCEQIVNLILSVKEPEQMLTGEFIDSYQKIENEIMATMQDIEKNSERIGNLLIYNIKSKYNIRSTVATSLSERYKDRFIVIYEKIGNKINVAGRDQSRKWNCDRTLKAAVRGLKASAGGHEAAGGATLDAKDWDKFKSALIKIVG
jgi:single-stranded DNA-specific DHH superfamily exonuclease